MRIISSHRRNLPAWLSSKVLPSLSFHKSSSRKSFIILMVFADLNRFVAPLINFFDTQRYRRCAKYIVPLIKLRNSAPIGDEKKKVGQPLPFYKFELTQIRMTMYNGPSTTHIAKMIPPSALLTPFPEDSMLWVSRPFNLPRSL